MKPAYLFALLFVASILAVSSGAPLGQESDSKESMEGCCNCASIGPDTSVGIHQLCAERKLRKSSCDKFNVLLHRQTQIDDKEYEYSREIIQIVTRIISNIVELDKMVKEHEQEGEENEGEEWENENHEGEDNEGEEWEGEEREGEENEGEEKEGEENEGEEREGEENEGEENEGEENEGEEKEGEEYEGENNEGEEGEEREGEENEGEHEEENEGEEEEEGTMSVIHRLLDIIEDLIEG